MDAGPVQDLTGVDVSEAGDPALVEQRQLDRQAARRQPGEPFAGEPAAHGVRTELEL